VEERKAANRKALLEKYGSQEHLSKAPSKDARVTESESFVEYDESGGIKGAPKVKPKSKYPEDVYINNHTSVWGSWWSNFQWGYACCHSTVKNSYCTGLDGIKALEDEQMRKAGLEMGDVGNSGEEETEMSNEAAPPPPENINNGWQDEGDGARRKRTAGDMHDGVTEEEINDYRRKRNNINDPMGNKLRKGKLS
jgi:Pre-mRNA splicing Prp18-interacting factor